jgi:hypothetical protein
MLQTKWLGREIVAVIVEVERFFREPWELAQFYLVLIHLITLIKIGRGKRGEST